VPGTKNVASVWVLPTGEKRRCTLKILNVSG
jgi:hypothetical protein